jgi:transcriptional regulator with XRE-family HTH domain
VDLESLRRFARVVSDLRGDRSQKTLAELLGVAQSSIAGWENARNTPSLDNLERIAQMREMSPEELLALLYGRELPSSLPIDQQIARMRKADLIKLLKLIADRLEQE